MPSKTQTEVTARLENWWYDSLNHVMWGYIYDDVRNQWWDGARIHTSSLGHSPNTKWEKGMLIQTRNSIYLLGEQGK